MKTNYSFKLFVLALLFSASTIFKAQNNALHFDGANDKIDISNSPSLNFGINNSFSIEAWFNTTAGSYRILVSNRIDSPPYTGYELMLSSGAIDFSIISLTTSAAMKIVTTANNFNNGAWHHVVAVYRGNPNGNTSDIYVDGILQAKTVPQNALAGIITNTNMVTIGARQLVSAYNFNGSIDEVRIWNKELCLGEIVAKKNCHLLGNEYGLVAYYNFNQGIASGNNSTVTTLPDLTASNNTGTLTGFALTGGTSNWVTTGASVTGTCAPFGALAIAGNATLCVGQSTVLTASGANTYTWNTSSNSTSISVSPTITTGYYVVATDVNTCTVKQTATVVVNALPSVSATTATSLICGPPYQGTATLNASGANSYTWNTGSNNTSIAVTPTITTNYTVTGTNTITTCSNSAVITISVSTCAGIQNLVYNNALTVSPNPSTGLFILNGLEIGMNVEVYNSLGVLIYFTKTDSENLPIDLTNQSNGLYFIKCISENRTFINKVIKE